MINPMQSSLKTLRLLWIPQKESIIILSKDPLMFKILSRRGKYGKLFSFNIAIGQIMVHLI